MPPSPFRQIGRHGSKSVMPNGMLKKAVSHPPFPRCAGTHSFPSFVLGSKESSTDPWEGAGHGRLGVGRVKYRYASGFFSLRPRWITLFGHSVQISAFFPMKTLNLKEDL